jgi:hypothetical protein
LKRTRILAPVDEYITNLETYHGDHPTAGSPKLAIIDSMQAAARQSNRSLERKAAAVLLFCTNGEMNLACGGKYHLRTQRRKFCEPSNARSRTLPMRLDPSMSAPKTQSAAACCDADSRSC